MRKLGKRFDNVKETIQAYSPCGNGCLCGGCTACACFDWPVNGWFDGTGASNVSTNDSKDHAY